MTKIWLAVFALGIIFVICEAKKCKVYSESEADVEFESISKKNEKEFRKVEKKTKKPKDKNSRKKLFKENMKKINKHNKKEKTSFCQGPSKFAAMDEEEKQGYRGYKHDSSKDVQVRSVRRRRQTFPSSVDHSSKTGPVENQAGCGSCWAFSTSHTVTGAMAALKGQDVIGYSEQQIVDCSVNGDGCAGADASYGYNYLTTHEFKTDAQYPYANADQTCSAGTGSNFLLSDWGRTHSYGTVDVDAIKAVLVNQPIAIAIYVTSSFENYESGVYVHDDYEDCTSGGRLNHQMTLVGYGTDSETGLDYWLIKNSWGTWNGEDGYYRVKMGDNVCNIEIDSIYPIPNPAIPDVAPAPAPNPSGSQNFKSDTFDLDNTAGDKFAQDATDTFTFSVADTGTEDRKLICLTIPIQAQMDGKWKRLDTLLTPCSNRGCCA